MAGRKRNLQGWRKLSYEQMVAIMNSRSDCVYCHAPFTSEDPATRDRKDSSLGYDAPGNVVLCCRDCNLIKNSILSFEEMMVIGPIVADLKAKRIPHVLHTREGNAA
jgi:Zn-finger protein